MSEGAAEVGDIISNRYRLIEEIGRGGFGVVFRAVQLGMERNVAIKMLHPAGDPKMQEQMKERFKREAMMARNLNHPNTIRQYDFGEAADGSMYLVLEYLNGRNLVEVIRQEGALGDERVRAMAPGILKALAEAHAQGIVHRDLKPGNIMLCDIFGEKDFVKVLDFGIAKTMMGDTDLTAAGVALGSPRYMPPELLRGDQPTPSSDLYSIAITLAEAIIGKPLLPFENSVEAAQAQLSPEPLKVPEELTHSSLWPWLQKAMSKEIADRFQTADEMLQALGGYQSGYSNSGFQLPESRPSVSLPDPVPASEPVPAPEPVVTTSPVVVVSDEYDDAEEDDHSPTMRIDAQEAIQALSAGRDLGSFSTPVEDSGEDDGATQMIGAGDIPNFGEVSSREIESSRESDSSQPAPSWNQSQSLQIDAPESEEDMDALDGATEMVDISGVPGLGFGPATLPLPPVSSHPLPAPTLPSPSLPSPSLPSLPAPGFPEHQSHPGPQTPSQPFSAPMQTGQPAVSPVAHMPTPSFQGLSGGQTAPLPAVSGGIPGPSSYVNQEAPTDYRTEFVEFDINQVTAEQKSSRNKWFLILAGVLGLLFVGLLLIVATFIYLSTRADDTQVVVTPPITIAPEADPLPEIVAPPAELDFRIYSVPEGAEVFLGGTSSGETTPARMKIQADRLPLNGELKMDGFEAVSFTLSEAESTLNLRLVETAKPPEPKVVEKRPVDPKPKPKPQPKPKPKPKPTGPVIIPLFD